MRIFIAGCARSGTSLTRNLMNCFQDTYAYEQEAPLSKFDEIERAASNLVVKRTASAYKRLPNLPTAISLIYCLRHPIDVLTSTHSRTKHLRRFHVTQERWVDEYNALYLLRTNQPGREICYVRYEDLVRTPNSIQQKIGRSFGLSPRILFSEDSKNAIVDTSVGKWRSQPEFLEYFERLPCEFRKRVAVFCSEFGYELP